MMIQSLRQKWKQYLKKWSLWSPFVSLWLGSCFGDFSGFSYFFGEFPAVSLVLGSCFGDFSDFSYFFPGLFRLFRWFWVAVLGISAVSATFFKNFSCFWLDWGAVLEVLWITATQGLPAINLWLLYIMLIQCGEYYAKE